MDPRTPILAAAVQGAAPASGTWEELGFAVLAAVLAAVLDWLSRRRN